MSDHGGGHGKIFTILKWIFIFFVIALILFWLLSGGPQKAWEVGKHLGNPVGLLFEDATSSDSTIRLPWQPTEMTRGPDISDYVGVADSELARSNTQTESRTELQQFGDPSPYTGTVHITNRVTGRADEEFIELQASGSAAVGVSNWSLQSAMSGVRVYIGNATPAFISGVVNPVASIFLSPGERVIVSSGPSPLGVSFRENICTGLLQQYQRFTPPLQSSWIQGVSYNDCVHAHYSDPSFPLPTWRVFLHSSLSLWRQNDVIRLLDASGRVVDVSY